MTNEPPIGLKSNMLGSYKTEPLSDNKFFTTNSQSANFKKIAFGLTMFHAILIQRQYYGPLGWNQNHAFTVSDLQISMQQLFSFVHKSESVPFDALKYLIGRCNYGGRVTESADQRVLMALLEDFLSPKVLDPEYTYCQDEQGQSLYKFPHGNVAIQKHLDQITNMPSEEMPQIFGFHPNADIKKNQEQAENLTNLLLQIGEVEGARLGFDEDGEGDTDAPKKVNRMRTIMSRANQDLKKPEDEQLANRIKEIVRELPTDTFDIEVVKINNPDDRSQSLNTVLTQELSRFNGLLGVILNTVQDLDSAQKGEILMTEQLSATRQQLIHGFVPDAWLEVSYPTLKPLGSYIRDLKLRIETLDMWVRQREPPAVFWLSGFFFPQSFLTALLQNRARKSGKEIAIDKLEFEFHFTNVEDPTDHEQEVFSSVVAKERNFVIPEVINGKERQDDGALISGLYFEGCRWDYNLNSIGEQNAKELFSKVPIIWLLPVEKQERPKTPRSLMARDTASISTMRRVYAAQSNDAGSMHVRNNRSQVPISEGGTSDIMPAQAQYNSNAPQINQQSSLQTAAISQKPGTAAQDAPLSQEDIMEAADTLETAQRQEETYECPLYRTTDRYGALLTNGHSTNFIIMVKTPMPLNLETGDGVDAQSTITRAQGERGTSNHWIKRGAAMVCQLRN